MLTDTLDAIRANPAQALSIERQAYTRVVQATETAAHFRDCYALLQPALAAAGQNYAQPRATAPAGKLRIGFYLAAPVMLAHAQNLKVFLDGLALIGSPIDAEVYSVGKPGPEFQAAFPRAHCLSLIDGELGAFQALRALATEHGLSALVWISSPVGLIFAANAGLAPKLIWWSMKYHAIHDPKIDGLMTCTHLWRDSVTMDGQKWLCTGAALDDLTNPGPKPVKTHIGPVYGCFGREVKLQNPDYLRAVAEVLRQVPDAVFLYSGRADPPAVRQVFAAEGVANRTHYIGWIDTRKGAQVLDVYLDSFPFASGHTAFEAMAAGVPVVVLRTPESLESSAASVLCPLIDGAAGEPSQQAAAVPLAPCYPASVATWIAVAVSLGHSPECRASLGRAGADFVRAHLSDKRAYARRVVECLKEICG